MNDTGKGWQAPFIDKRQAATEDVLRFFSEDIRPELQHYLKSGLPVFLPEWTQKEIDLINALTWHRLGFSQLLLTAVFTCGFIEGQHYREH